SGRRDRDRSALPFDPEVARRQSAAEQSGHAVRPHIVERRLYGSALGGGDIAFRPETWATIGAVLKPGGYLLAFGGTRTHHRIWCAIEDAGFVVQDRLAWIYGQGFPKGRTQLKPAFEPIVVAYKPGGKRVLQVHECRISGMVNRAAGPIGF